jgi:hypothetical protein
MNGSPGTATYGQTPQAKGGAASENRTPDLFITSH